VPKKKLKLEKYVSTKPLLPFRATKWKDFRTLKEEETKARRRKENGNYQYQDKN
jgi:hypothetical protein